SHSATSRPGRNVLPRATIHAFRGAALYQPLHRQRMVGRREKSDERLESIRKKLDFKQHQLQWPWTIQQSKPGTTTQRHHRQKLHRAAMTTTRCLASWNQKEKNIT